MDEYVSLDVQARVTDVDLQADIQDMSQVPNASFDSVLCSEVLENVRRPEAAMSELARITGLGGFIVSAPYLSRLPRNSQ